MFYLTYLRHELRRRLGRTVVTVLGLAVGVGLVVAVMAMSAGLDNAQTKVLGPLAGVGTDLMVTRPVQAASPSPGTNQGQGGFGFGGGRGGAGGLSRADQDALLAENKSVITDLSKLGKPGEAFSHDFFLPATQLTFPSEDATKASQINGVADVALGLTLLATHQEGTVPAIVAEIQTGGETQTQTSRPEPMTDAERAAFQACAAAAGAGTQDGPGGAGEGGHRGAFEACLPQRFKEFTATFVTPLRTLRQAIDPPQTNITSDPYTIAGVDTSKPDIGLIGPAQVASGTFLTARNQALLAQAYAQRKNLKLGDELDLNGSKFKIVGLVTPPLSGQAADVYLELSDLQKLSGREGRANVMLVRAAASNDVQRVTSGLQTAVPGSQVSSAKDLADKVSGSLIDSGRLVRRMGIVLAIIGLLSAFLIASLLTLSSVSKRVRELGTLKAIGWRQGLVVRQIIAESLAQSLIGGVVGAALGIAGAYAISLSAPALSATSSAAQGPSFFGLGNVATATTSTVALTAPVTVTSVLVAIGLAIAGGLVAGATGAWRAARLNPADAIRQVG